MQLNRLLGVILGLLTIVVTLAIAPSIATANTAVSANLTADANKADMIGLSVVLTFGAPLCILGLLAMGGLFAIGSWKTGASMRDMLGVIMVAVIVIIGLNFMLYVVGYSSALIDAGSGGFETVLYGLIPLLVYLSIIGLAGLGVYRGAKSLKGGGQSKSYAGGY